MDNSFRQQSSDRQETIGFLSGLQIFNRILSWIADLIQLTEEQQMEAGIYLGGRRY